MSEEEIIKTLQVLIGLEEFNKLSYKENQAIQGLLDLYNKQNIIIDKMINELSLPGITYWRYELMHQITPQKPIYDLIKEHFYSEVENERKK